MNRALPLSLLLLNSLLFVAANGQSNETKSEVINQNSTSWYNETKLTWQFPIFHLKSSSIPSRRYNRTFQCTGNLFHRNAVIAPRQCIKDFEAYVIATGMTSFSSTGVIKHYPYVIHHRLYPPVEYRSYEFASTEYRKKITHNITVVKEKIPGMVILFFDTTIHYTSPARLFESPTIYEIHSKNINRDCLRISLISDSQRQISTHKVPEKIISWDDFTETYKAIRNSSHKDTMTKIADISFDGFTPILATRPTTISDPQAVLGSSLICRNQNNNTVLVGILVDTSFEGLHIYALVRDMYDWVQYKGYEFGKRTERLTYSERDPYEYRYDFDLDNNHL